MIIFPYKVQIAKLKTKLESARKARKDHEKSIARAKSKGEAEEEEEEVVILTRTNKRGKNCFMQIKNINIFIILEHFINMLHFSIFIY